MRRQTQDVSCDDEISSPAQCVKELNKIRNTLRENTISAIVSQMWDNPAVGMKTPNEEISSSIRQDKTEKSISSVISIYYLDWIIGAYRANGPASLYLRASCRN